MKTNYKMILVAVLLITAPLLMFAQSVGINNNGSSPNGSAMLDVSSSTKGFLVPRMTMAQRDAIISPATGLLAYQTDNSPGYYNGTAWTLVVSGGGGFNHYIGELFGGGIVVAVWKQSGVEHGLIASLVDMQTSGAAYTMGWSGNTSVLIGATAQSPFDGQANTNAIIAQSDGGNTPDKAATVCNAYINTETGTGVYSDWYLPAAWELNQCYNAASIVNIVLGVDNGSLVLVYFSSTEYSSVYAWNTNFTSGTTYLHGKDAVERVRAVRRF